VKRLGKIGIFVTAALDDVRKRLNLFDDSRRSQTHWRVEALPTPNAG